MYDAVIDETRIKELLQANQQPSPSEALSILEKGRTLAGLSPEEAAVLIKVTGKGVLDEIFDTASSIKQTIYGDRLVFFAPLYVSNYCINDCGYCGFHAANPAPRKKLTMEEIREQTGRIIGMGHKRVLLEAGEDERNNPIDYILNAIDAVYAVKKGGGGDQEDKRQYCSHHGGKLPEAQGKEDWHLPALPGDISQTDL